MTHRSRYVENMAIRLIFGQSTVWKFRFEKNSKREKWVPQKQRKPNSIKMTMPVRIKISPWVIVPILDWQYKHRSAFWTRVLKSFLYTFGHICYSWERICWKHSTFCFVDITKVLWKLMTNQFVEIVIIINKMTNMKFFLFGFSEPFCIVTVEFGQREKYRIKQYKSEKGLDWCIFDPK